MSFGIWNNIDELALYLGVERLPKEDDDSFKDRLYRVSRFMYKTDSYNQLQSIAAQCGLEVKPVLQIDSDNDFVCSIDNDYFTLDTGVDFLRVFIGQQSITLLRVLEGLSKIQGIDIIQYNSNISNIPIQHIIKNSNYKLAQEFMSDTRMHLKNKNIEKGSIEFEDKTNFISEKDGLSLVKKAGDYFVDYKNGYIESKNISELGQVIKYKYKEKPFILEYSEIALTPINSYFKHGINKDNIKFIPFLLNNNVWAK